MQYYLTFFLLTPQSLNGYRPKKCDVENSNLNIDYNLTLTFDLILRTSKLTKTSHYNSYQNNLYRLIKFLKENKQLGYKRISHILFERGYRSVRTKSVLKNNYVYSIYKKGKIREERINRSFDSQINNMKVKFCKFIKNSFYEKNTHNTHNT